jgi:predicted metal-dependent enzyme (double-stranded beta helix superfamily)
VVSKRVSVDIIVKFLYLYQYRYFFRLEVRTMVATDELVAGCMDAIAEQDPRRAVREVLEQAVTSRRLVDAFGNPTAGLHVLYNAPDLTVINVVWPPLFSLYPHDHRMWAAICIYSGREDNAFYRRSDKTIVSSGGKELVEGDVQLLGDDVIHAVHNPARSYTGAIHVYGGDFIDKPRSQWDPETLEEQPYDLESVRGEFETAEYRFKAAQN